MYFAQLATVLEYIRMVVYNSEYGAEYLHNLCLEPSQVQGGV